MRNLTGVAGVAIFGIASVSALLVAPYMASTEELVGKLFACYYYSLCVIFGGTAILQFLPMMMGYEGLLEKI